jgi:tRNA(fMet)-specific endonuclease VapC
MFVLDTDHITLFARDVGQTGQRLRDRLRTVSEDQRSTTIVTLEEQTRGRLAVLANARSTEKIVDAYKKFLDHLEDYRSIRVIEFDSDAGRVYDELKRSRLGVGTMDLRIAAIVMARDATLLSRNLGDFRKVSGLKVEDWTS